MWQKITMNEQQESTLKPAEVSGGMWSCHPTMGLVVGWGDYTPPKGNFPEQITEKKNVDFPLFFWEIV